MYFVGTFFMVSISLEPEIFGWNTVFFSLQLRKVFVQKTFFVGSRKGFSPEVENFARVPTKNSFLAFEFQGNTLRSYSDAGLIRSKFLTFTHPKIV